MARYKPRSKRLNINKKSKGDLLTSYEFNSVVDAINDLTYDVSYDSTYVTSYIEDKLTYVDDKLTYVDDKLTYVDDKLTYVDETLTHVDQTLTYVDDKVSNITSYVETEISPSIDELLDRSSKLLGITSYNTTSIEGLLAQSAALLGVSQNHETRISSAEELLAASQQLLNEINGRTAYDIPSTNGNVQQDIDTLLAQSAALLGVIETTKSESYNYTNVKYNDMKEYVDNSYDKMYSYVEDTTLTFTIEGIRDNTYV